METTTLAPSMQRPPLPERWTRKIFAELQGSYGSRFLDMWRSGQALPDGTDAGLKNAMARWAEKLAGFADRPELIRKALEALPLHPPTLPEFVALCRQQHGDMPKALPAPKLSAEEVAPRIAAVAKRLTSPSAGSLAWAHTPPQIKGPWEKSIIDLAEQGDPRFRAILAEHVAKGVIRSERAKSVLEGADHAAAA